jgi:hypothetical protein
MKIIDVPTSASSPEDLVRMAKQEAEIVLTEGPDPVARAILIAEQGGPMSVSIVAPQRDTRVPLAPRKLGLHPAPSKPVKILVSRCRMSFG